MKTQTLPAADAAKWPIGGIHSIPIGEIAPGIYQPRRAANQKVDELKASMLAHGQRDPIIVAPAAPADRRKAGGRGLVVIAGHTRHSVIESDPKAFPEQQILARVVAHPGAVEAMFLALDENGARDSMTFADTAAGIARCWNIWRKENADAPKADFAAQAIEKCGVGKTIVYLALQIADIFDEIPTGLTRAVAGEAAPTWNRLLPFACFLATDEAAADANLRAWFNSEVVKEIKQGGGAASFDRDELMSLVNRLKSPQSGKKLLAALTGNDRPFARFRDNPKLESRHKSFYKPMSFLDIAWAAAAEAMSLELNRDGEAGKAKSAGKVMSAIEKEIVRDYAYKYPALEAEDESKKGKAQAQNGKRESAEKSAVPAVRFVGIEPWNHGAGVAKKTAQSEVVFGVAEAASGKTGAYLSESGGYTRAQFVENLACARKALPRLYPHSPRYDEKAQNQAAGFLRVINAIPNGGGVEYSDSFCGLHIGKENVSLFVFRSLLRAATDERDLWDALRFLGYCRYGKKRDFAALQPQWAAAGRVTVFLESRTYDGKKSRPSEVFIYFIPETAKWAAGWAGGFNLGGIWCRLQTKGSITDSMIVGDSPLEAVMLLFARPVSMRPAGSSSETIRLPKSAMAPAVAGLQTGKGDFAAARKALERLEQKFVAWASKEVKEKMGKPEKIGAAK